MSADLSIYHNAAWEQTLTNYHYIEDLVDEWVLGTVGVGALIEAKDAQVEDAWSAGKQVSKAGEHTEES